jgi:hypothetical protein
MPTGDEMNKDHGVRCRSLLLSGSLLAFAGLAQATISASSAALYAEPRAASLTQVNGAAGPLSAVGYTSPNGLLGASAYGEADYGALHASATAISAGDAQVRAQGSSLWIDNVAMSGSFTNAVTARGSFSLSGALSSRTDPGSTGAAANSTIAATVRVNGVSVLSIGAQVVSRNGAIVLDDISVTGNNVSFTPGSLAGVYSFDMPIPLGPSFQLMASLDAFVQSLTSDASDGASANSNFGSTGTWGGISEVRLADGTVVTDYRLVSDSGFDWRNGYGSAATPIPTPVPEPGTWALMLAGLAVLGRVAARRGTRRGAAARD